MPNNKIQFIKSMAKKINLGVSGDPGSFSEEAGLLYAQRIGIKPTLCYLTDMEGVLAAVEANQIDLGIFPVVNSRGGLVKMAFEAMGRHLFTVIDEVWLDVRQCLLAKPGTQLQQLKKIISHPQAIAQCERYLLREFKKAAFIEWQDTAKAAKDLASGKFGKTSAVIAPQRAARLYGLEVLVKDIQDNHPNLTTFIVVIAKGKKS
jgi:prephenate dehydratase